MRPITAIIWLAPTLRNLTNTTHKLTATSFLHPRRTLSVSSRVLVRNNGYSPKAPRWVNPKSGKDKDPTTPRQDEDSVEDKDENEGDPESSKSSTSPDTSSPTHDSSQSDSSSTSSPPSSPASSSSSNPGSIARQSVPEIYPQVLALPIARRPLFPGFYKAVVIRNPSVVAAIKEMMKRGQPYLGAFLLKDENTDSDVITDINSVHQVGVFAQITSVFAAAGRGDDDKEEGLTAVLYPHRRIKITELVKAGGAKIEEIEQQQQPQTVEPPSPPPTPPPTPLPEGQLTDTTPTAGSSNFLVFLFYSNFIAIDRTCSNGLPP